MSLTGKYDFAGIKKWGARGISLALLTVPYLGAWMKSIPLVNTAVNGALELFVNWLANNGLIVLNVAAITIEGKWDQQGFDKAMDDAFTKLEIGRGQLTPEQIEAMDEIVKNAFRKFAPITHHHN